MSFKALASLPGTGQHQLSRGLHYEMYGLKILSDVPLLTDPLGEGGEQGVDLVIRLASQGEALPALGEPRVAVHCGHGTITSARYDRDDGMWLRYPACGTFQVLPGNSQVRAFIDADADERISRVVLTCHVLSMVLHRRGTPSLHASAVATRYGAVVFLGPKGRGKSSMAAGFLRQGAALLTDDALPLDIRGDGVYGVPSLPLMKVWRETAERALELTHELPRVVADMDKRLLVIGDRYRFAGEPVRIGAVYILDRADPETAPSISEVRGRDGVAALLAQTSMSNLLTAAEAPMLLRAYSRLVAQAPIRIFRYPGGFEHQQAARTALMADLADRWGQSR